MENEFDGDWRPADELPESSSNEVLVEYGNDLGIFHAIGLFYRTVEDKPVFLEVLTGTAFDWVGSILRWKFFEV